jgi:hypothetical protein
MARDQPCAPRVGREKAARGSHGAGLFDTAVAVVAALLADGTVTGLLSLARQTPEQLGLNVRFTPKSGHCIAPQRMSALCQ